MSKEWDLFFYYGEADLQEEIRQDILNGVVTSRKKLFFNRSDSAGVTDFENAPTGLAIQVGLRFSIVRWLAYRNLYTGNGSNDSKERRIATSQNEIDVEQDYQKGNVNLTINYIPFVSFTQNNTLSISLGV